MKKIILLAFFAISIFSCRENKKSLIKIKSEITFNELDLTKSKPQYEIEEFLESNQLNELSVLITVYQKFKELHP